MSDHDEFFDKATTRRLASTVTTGDVRHAPRNAPPPPPFVVEELVTNHLQDHPGQMISSTFQQCIATFLDRGYRLHSWSLAQTMTSASSLHETIIAVFEYVGTQRH